MAEFNMPEITLPALIGEVLPTVGEALDADCQFESFYGGTDEEGEKKINAAKAALMEEIGDYLEERAAMLIRYGRRIRAREADPEARAHDRGACRGEQEAQAEQLRKTFRGQHAKRYRL